MATDAKKPYGDVSYADPGYQADGKKRYPLDTERHVRAAWSYINQKDNAAKYTSEQVSAIKGRIKAAGKKLGIQFSDDGSGRSFSMEDDNPMDISERRYTPGLVEVRAAEGKRPRISGVAAVFDRPSRNLGGFVEVVSRSFFDLARADGWPDVLCRYNHDDAYLLGSTPVTLQLSLDTAGLRYDVEPPQARQDVLELVQRGDVRRSSFAFRKTDDDWTTTDQGYPLRTLISGELVDVAPVNMPAYAETSAKVRSLDCAYESLAAKVGAAVEEVRSAAETNDLRRFLVRSDADGGKPQPPKRLFGPAALAALQLKTDPWADQG